jgi:hypothetical protein
LSPFELLRFEATPVAPAVAVVELDGRFTGPEPSRPRLLVETGGVSREMPPLEAGGTPWSAVFAIPLAALSDPDAAFSLVPGRGPLIALPSPSESGGDDDRVVRLARTANDLRHRLSSATENAAAAAERVIAVGEERDRLAAELADARAALSAAEARSAESHDAALAAREEQARTEGEADEARAAAERAQDEARAAVQDELERAAAEAGAARSALAELQDRVIAAEDEARAARVDLRDARARVESLMRENRTARIAAARARVPSATPDSDEFRAARLGPEWAAGAEEGDEDATSPDHLEAGVPGQRGSEGGSEYAGDAPATDPSDSAAPLTDDSPDPTAPLTDDSPESTAPRADDAPVPTTPFHSGDSGDDPTAPLHSGDDPAAPLHARDDPTAPLHPEAGDAPTTARLAAGSPRLWRDEDGESVRILRPRTTAGRLRPARLPDDPDDEEEGDDVLDPATAGARTLEPAEMSARRRAVAVVTNPRVIVGGIFVLLILALVLIFNGVGLV